MLRLVYVATLMGVAALLGWNIVLAQLAESIRVAGPRLAAEPWGWVTIIDVYLGFLAFGGYVVARERSVRRALPWLAGLFLAGNIASAAYVVWVLWRGDWAIAALASPRRSGT